VADAIPNGTTRAIQISHRLVGTGITLNGAGNTLTTAGRVNQLLGEQRAIRMNWFSRKVKVTFIDDATGSAFATTEIPPADLPETFEIATTLHLDDTDWSVIDAAPATREDYSKVGRLTLRLRRVVKVDPSKILFSLPSICDRIPAVGDGTLGGDECVLAEDDWRQFELVSRQFGAETAAEIEAIRMIHEHERAEVGWRKLHVRSRPDPPITGTLTLKEIDRAFGGGILFRGLSYHGASSPIVSGYSFRAADGLQCYGTEEGGRVTVLGIVQDTRASPPTASADSLAEIARAFDLEMVQWCRCERASWDVPLFRHILLSSDA
jgi:hypothetical protein